MDKIGLRKRYKTQLSSKPITKHDQIKKIEEARKSQQQNSNDKRENGKNQHSKTQTIEKQSQYTKLMIKQSDDKISKLISNVIYLQSQLYPKLDELQTQKDELPQINQLNKAKSNKKWIDQYTSKQKYENDNLMKRAQLQLNKRLKNKILIQYQKLNTDNQRGYAEEYQRLKTDNSINKNDSDYITQSLEVPIIIQEDNKKRVKIYSDLKDKPVIIDYARQKLRSLSSVRQKHKIDSQSSLRVLQTRKKKQIQSQKSIWANQDYEKQLQNINLISSRLKRIYSRKIALNLNQISQQQLQSNNLIKKQTAIFEKLNSNTCKLSNKHKQQLMIKFHEILNTMTTSVSPRNSQKNLLYFRNNVDQKTTAKMNTNRFQSLSRDIQQSRQMEKKIQYKLKRKKSQIEKLFC